MTDAYGWTTMDRQILARFASMPGADGAGYAQLATSQERADTDAHYAAGRTSLL
jgi:hypothetical protein